MTYCLTKSFDCERTAPWLGQSPHFYYRSRLKASRISFSFVFAFMLFLKIILFTPPNRSHSPRPASVYTVVCLSVERLLHLRAPRWSDKVSSLRYGCFFCTMEFTTRQYMYLAALFSYRVLYWVIYSRYWSFPCSTTSPSSSSSLRSTLKMGDDKIMTWLV